MSRKWMAAAGVAAILALIVGVQVGRSVIPSSSEKAPKPPAPVRFVDSLSGLSLSYPGNWHRIAATDPQVRLLASDGGARSLSLRIAPSDIARVTTENLPVAREFTDTLLSSDQRAHQTESPRAVTIGGILGYRYRYTFDTSDGATSAHIHYFLFRPRQLIQLVFQVTPASSLAAAEPVFDRIAGSLRPARG